MVLANRKLQVLTRKHSAFELGKHVHHHFEFLQNDHINFPNEIKSFTIRRNLLINIIENLDEETKLNNLRAHYYFTKIPERRNTYPLQENVYKFCTIIYSVTVFSTKSNYIFSQLCI